MKTLLPLLALCLSSCAAPPPAPKPTLPADVAAVVEMPGSVFAPETVTIHVGGTVLWRNTSGLVHTVTFDPAKGDKPGDVLLPAGVAPFDSGKIAVGDAYWHSFTVPGTYKYICAPHEDFGMVGSVVVQP